MKREFCSKNIVAVTAIDRLMAVKYMEEKTMSRSLNAQRKRIEAHYWRIN